MQNKELASILDNAIEHIANELDEMMKDGKVTIYGNTMHFSMQHASTLAELIKARAVIND